MSSPLAGNGIKGSLDSIKGRTEVGQVITVRGWAADQSRGAPVDVVEVIIDDLEVITALTGDPRTDVVTAFNNPGWLNSGWSASVSLDHLLPGQHRIEAKAYSLGREMVLDGTRYIEVVSAK